MQSLQRVGLIGFGEAGSILGADLRHAGCAVCSYDLLLDRPQERTAMLERMSRARVRAAGSVQELLDEAELVISAVTASSSAAVGRLAAATLHSGHVYLDINSVSPATKRATAELVQGSGAIYIEAAVMAPIPPQRLKTPMLLGGPAAARLAPALAALGLQVTAVADSIGVASAIKMCRSIMIKGVEALTVEAMLAARHFGAEDAVLASLDKTWPAMGWLQAQPDYLVSRVAEHGLRRAAELREVVATLHDIGQEPRMATAIAAAQEQLVARMRAAGIDYPRARPFSWRELADALAAAESPNATGATSAR